MNSAQANKLQPALIAGISLGLASSLVSFVSTLSPALQMLGCSCCILGIGGGFLAVYLYLKNLPPAPSKPYGEGALVGFLTGVVATVVSTILAIPIQLAQQAMGTVPDVEEAIAQMEEAGFPEGCIQFVQLISPSETGISLGSLALGFVFGLIGYGILATLGGILGAAVLAKELPISTPGTAPPTPPPATL